MSFFHRKPLAQINQQPQTGAAEKQGLKQTSGFFAQRSSTRELGVTTGKENETEEICAPESLVPGMYTSAMHLEQQRSPLAPSSAELPQAQIARSKSSHHSPLFRSSFDGRMGGKRSRDSCVAANTTTVVPSSNTASAPALMVSPCKQLEHAPEPQAKTARKGSRHGVAIPAFAPPRNSALPTFDDSYNTWWQAMEGNKDGMAIAQLNLTETRFKLAQRFTDLLVEDVQPTLAPRLLACMTRVQQIKDRMERGTPKTQYSPRNPTSSARLIMHKVEAAAQTASQLDDLELTDHQSLL